MTVPEPLRPDYMGMNGFVWWQGVVEDIYDPLKIGRVRVRVLGWHTDDKSQIPTEDLPWAHVMMPSTSPSLSGKGWSPTGLLQGGWVMGFFRDGLNGQEPVVMGTFGGVNTVRIPVSERTVGFVESRASEILGRIEASRNDVGMKAWEMEKNPAVNTSVGFCDPSGKYPLISRMAESDTNRLARGEEVQNTIVSKKRSELVTCPTALYGFWKEPETPYRAQYPHNQVFESQAGHVIEYDDTPGSERLHWYHCSGSFNEIHPKGSEVHKVVGNAWDITLNDKMILVKGNCSFNSDKILKVMVGKDLEIEVIGDAKMLVKGDMTVDVQGNYLQKVGGKCTIASEGPMLVMAPRIDLNPEGESPSSIRTFLDRARGFVNGLIEMVSPSDLVVRQKED